MKLARIISVLLVFFSIIGLPYASAEQPEGETWEIWGAQMATEPEVVDYDFRKATDPEGFRPCLTPYLLDNQAEARGNVIVLSGGADRRRNNKGEGIPACEYLNDIGYNAFLLDYRVKPYTSFSGTLDLQRAVRYLKHNGQELGIAQLDKLAVMGFSAGAMHAYGLGIAFTGNTTPDAVYKDYVCDAVDAESSDVTVVCCIYAAGMAHGADGTIVDAANSILLLEDTDPNLPQTYPAFFFAGASGHPASHFCVEAYECLNPLTTCELHMYGGIDSTFGLGTEYDGADQMRDQLQAFLEFQFGYRDRSGK